MNNAREDTMEDPFLRLPDELLSSIFNRLDDLKSLFFCSLVSKHFASLISQVGTVSITLSGSETYSEDYYKIVAKLVTDVCNSTIEQIHTLLESPSFQHMKLPKFLGKLRKLQHIHLDYESLEQKSKCGGSDSVQLPFPMWEVKFADSSAKIESFVALVRAGSIQFKDSENELVLDHKDSLLFYLEETRGCLDLFNGRYMEWMCVIRMLLKHHSSLQRVTITESGKHGALAIGHEQLVNIGNEVFDEVAKELSRKVMRTKWLPVLSLPLSGYVLKRVLVMTVYVRGDDPRTSDYESTVIKEVIQQVISDETLRQDMDL